MKNKPFKKLKYCIHVLQNNIFIPCEIDYYRGLLINKQPHGIDNKYWKKAFNIVGVLYVKW